MSSLYFKYDVLTSLYILLHSKIYSGSPNSLALFKLSLARASAYLNSECFLDISSRCSTNLYNPNLSRDLSNKFIIFFSRLSFNLVFAFTFLDASLIFISSTFISLINSSCSFLFSSYFSIMSNLLLYVDSLSSPKKDVSSTNEPVIFLCSFFLLFRYSFRSLIKVIILLSLVFSSSRNFAFLLSNIRYSSSYSVFVSNSICFSILSN